MKTAMISALNRALQTANDLQKLAASWLVATLAILAAANAGAQAVTVISNSSYAQDCYRAAAATALKLSASRDDLATCTRALEYENLTRNDQARTYINRGIVQTALEKYQDALADYNAASNLVPDMPEAFISRGNLWFLAEKYQRAVSEYTQAMQMDFSRMHIAYYNRGLANENLGKREEAMADYREALKLAPDFKQALDRLDILGKPPAQ